MTSDAHTSRNWFDQGGQAYARFRPEYPRELVEFLTQTTSSRELAVDVGCGNGQLTAQLACYFDAAIGIDPSADQLDHAVHHERIGYLRGSAERIPLQDHAASLITAAQSAHWFNLPAFYAEARRIATVRAVIALISYGMLQLEGELEERFQRFYDLEIGAFWPPERKLVDNGYRDLNFPFEELKSPQLTIQRDWALSDFLGYLSTWSAVRAAIEAGHEDLLTSFTHDISQLWGNSTTHPTIWPIHMRVGIV